MDSEYLRQTVGRCLVEGLAEVNEQRPADPIEFLAQWILQYKESTRTAEKRAAFKKPLTEELEKAREEEQHQEHLREEAERIRAEQDKISPSDPVEPSLTAEPEAPAEAEGAAELRSEESAELPPAESNSQEEDTTALPPDPVEPSPDAEPKAPTEAEAAAELQPEEGADLPPAESNPQDEGTEKEQLQKEDSTVPEDVDNAELKPDESASEIPPSQPEPSQSQPEEEGPNDPENTHPDLAEDQPAAVLESSAPELEDTHLETHKVTEEDEKA